MYKVEELRLPSLYEVDALVYAEVTWNIVHLTEEHSLYKVDALVYAEVTWNIVNLTEEHSLYKVDALVYTLR